MIAIIGGGIGGASASHFIKLKFDGNEDLKIHLFEPNKIGGRLATIFIDGNEYEAGGSIIHSRNRLMKYFVNLLGLKETPYSDANAKKFAFWNGNELIFKSSNYQVVTLTKLVYQYGLQPFQLNHYIDSILDDFEKVYDNHENNQAFKNLTSLLSSMNMKYPEMLKTSTEEHFKNLGYSLKFIEEMIKVSLVVNYGQENNVQSFVGCVSAAGAGSSLWSIKGGNKKVPEMLIKQNDNIELFSSIVDRITLNSTKTEQTQYTLRYKSPGSSEDYHFENYDIVIIGKPLTDDHDMPIKFRNFDSTKNFKFPGKYQITYATFVKGTLRPSYFGDEDFFDAIFSCDPNKTTISSISRLETVKGTVSDVWKIFSKTSLERQVINKIFSEVVYVKEVKWKAYPQYNTRQRSDRFCLHDGLYYINAIEWAASAMEMSAIGGRNVAILAHKNYMKTCDNNNSQKLKKIKPHSSQHVEL
ncbi:prenylcysteine oxidase-like isoform X2 [Aphidius gifuensis]|uniref:prenylcysteine oxidase-like isoform X2 n=1 Tax=Aphidius gifuensis TaxID=684658 RepID=UPI001CDB5840|nr:prenylcysteine oxidase-like isoform X2 [Aphidius gifuensis]